MDSIYFFLQQLINGLTIGSAYALIAIGYTMVYGIIGMINFAHGEIYMISSYIGFVVLAAMAMFGIDSVFLMAIGALVCSIILTSVYGYSVERVAYRPLRAQPRLIALISAIGMSIFLQNVVVIGQGNGNVAIPNLSTAKFLFNEDGGFSISISYMQIAIWVATITSMLALTWFISKSKLGRACRACAEDMKMAGLLGINTDKVISITFVIGASLAAVAGVFISLYYGSINPYIGVIAGLKAFTAAVLGGIGSIPGAMLGGLILGVAEAMTSGYISGEYKDVVSFGILILILLFRPSGILGKPEVEKV